jgi:hypothetical protein
MENSVLPHPAGLIFLSALIWLYRICEDELLRGGVGKIATKNTDAALMCSLLVTPAARDAGANRG